MWLKIIETNIGLFLHPKTSLIWTTPEKGGACESFGSPKLGVGWPRRDNALHSLGMELSMLETFGALGCKSEATRRQNHTKGLAEYGRPDQKKYKDFTHFMGYAIQWQQSWQQSWRQPWQQILTTNLDDKPWLPTLLNLCQIFAKTLKHDFKRC